MEAFEKKFRGSLKGGKGGIRLYWQIGLLLTASVGRSATARQLTRGALERLG